MSQIFDIHVRSYEDDSPIITLTIDRSQNSDTQGLNRDNDVNQARQNQGCQMTVWDLKQMIHDQAVNHGEGIKIISYLEMERQLLLFNGVTLDFDHKTLGYYGIDAGATIHVKDAGEPVPARLSKLLVNSGPLILFYLFSNIHFSFYRILLGEKHRDQNREMVLYEEGIQQRIGRYMIYAHFIKGIFETLLVDRLAGRTVPMRSTIRRIIFFYIGIAMVGFSLFHPDLSQEQLEEIQQSQISQYIPAYLFPAATSISTGEELDTAFGGQLKYQILSLVFILAEFMNLQCHLHYTTLGKQVSNNMLPSIGRQEMDPMSRTRTSNLVASISKNAVLRDHGFSLVTGADYLWEFVAWLAFALVVDTLTCYGFVSVWLIWHVIRARGRNNRFTNDFRGEPAGERFAMIPFIF